jgi:hypothetical protein
MTMARDILVSIMGDDLYARDWMALLVVRDWRTRLVSEVTYDDDFMKFKAEQIHKVDFLLLDLDSYQNKPDILAEIDREMDPKNPSVFSVSAHAQNPKFLNELTPLTLPVTCLKMKFQLL